MAWTQCIINPVKKDKQAEITIGDSKICFGLSACRLLEKSGSNIFDKEAVEFYKNPDNENEIGILFLTKEKASEQSLPLIKNISEAKKKTGQTISLSCSGKKAMSAVFGETATEKIAEGQRSYKCKVTVSSEFKDMLIVDMRSKRVARPWHDFE